MSSLQFFHFIPILIAFVLVTCCLFSDHVTGSVLKEEKRVLQRYPRAKYRVGYMFGKRSSEEPASSELFDILSRDAVTKDEFVSLALKNSHLLNEIATVLDKNDDGYISLTDLL